MIIRLLLELAEKSHGYPQLPEWSDKTPDEQAKLWQRYLVHTAGYFYRSLENSICNKTVNEYAAEYHRSFSYISKKLPSGNSRMKFVPTDGFTKAEHQRLFELYGYRNREIEAYREKQLQIGFKRLMKVYHHLWD
jgi:hypothetical protein